jgi:peptidoglycan/LPS O-acetylase OafA/YrhL
MSAPPIPDYLRPFPLANHYPALHGLRVLAVVTIVQIHVSGALLEWHLLPRGPFYERSTSLWFAMDLFFLLSGFLIGTMLLRDDGAIDPRGVGRFYLRRSFRIVPPYFAVLTALALLGPASHAQRAGLWREYLYLTNYVAAPGPPVMSWAWSLCVEEHFYLAVPLLVAALGRLRAAGSRTLALVVLWLSGVLVRAADVALLHPRAGFDELFCEVYPRSHLRYDILVAGVLAAHLQRQHGAAIAARLAHRRWRLAAWALGLVCLRLLLTPPRGTSLRLWAALWWGGLTSVFYLPVVLVLINRPGAIGRQLGRRGFLYGATFGYGVYLVHVPVIDRLVKPVLVRLAIAWWHSTRTLAPVWLLWPLGVALTMVLSTALSYALHLLVEKPFLALRDRVTAAPGGPAS